MRASTIVAALALATAVAAAPHGQATPHKRQSSDGRGALSSSNFGGQDSNAGSTDDFSLDRHVAETAEPSSMAEAVTTGKSSATTEFKGRQAGSGGLGDDSDQTSGANAPQSGGGGGTSQGGSSDTMDGGKGDDFSLDRQVFGNDGVQANSGGQPDGEDGGPHDWSQDQISDAIFGAPGSQRV